MSIVTSAVVCCGSGRYLTPANVSDVILVIDFVCMSVHQPVCLCLSVSPRLSVSPYLSDCLSVYLCLCLSPSVCLFVPFSVSVCFALSPTSTLHKDYHFSSNAILPFILIFLSYEMSNSFAPHIARMTFT